MKTRKIVIKIKALEKVLLNDTDEEVYGETANDCQKSPEKILKCERCE